MSDFLHSFQFRQFLHLTYFSAKIKVKLILDMTHNSRKLFIETYIRDYVLEEEIQKSLGLILKQLFCWSKITSYSVIHNSIASKELCSKIAQQEVGVSLPL